MMFYTNQTKGFIISGYINVISCSFSFVYGSFPTIPFAMNTFWLVWNLFCYFQTFDVSSISTEFISRELIRTSDLLFFLILTRLVRACASCKWRTFSGVKFIWIMVLGGRYRWSNSAPLTLRAELKRLFDPMKHFL